MRLIRYRSQEGLVCSGVELEAGRAERLVGDPVREGVVRSGEVDEVEALLSPVLPGTIYCIGQNYRKHAIETGAAIPENPVIFMKPVTALQHPGGPVRIPKACSRGDEVDFEVELAVVIGKRGRDIPEAQALEHVFGYTVANDISARRWQKHGGGGQWIRGKSFDTFCPLGPALVTTDEIPDPQTLALRTTVNGVEMQKSSTSDMIFGVANLISFLSADTTLEPGTVILTGTPEGVGFTRNPPVFLRAGDEVSVEVEGIGLLTNRVEG
ncbi:MAG: fumarylacetoacetate hydrolase family protein [Phycisphaeraceae bacterium]